MCGIVGIAGVCNNKNMSVFHDLLIMNEVRGHDSTGVAVVDGDNNVSVVKDVIHPYGLLTSKDYYAAVHEKNIQCVIGHNRAATKGIVEKKNAHPFQVEHITGVHNGTLLSTNGLHGDRQFETDSETIYYHLAHKGVEDMWDELWGAAALVWWDNKEHSLHFLRNKERPLYMCLSEDKQTIFWASEDNILITAMARNGVRGKKTVAVKENTLFSFKIKKGKAVDVTSEPMIPKAKGFACFPPVCTTSKWIGTKFISDKVYYNGGNYYA